MHSPQIPLWLIPIPPLHFPFLCPPVHIDEDLFHESFALIFHTLCPTRLIPSIDSSFALSSKRPVNSPLVLGSSIRCSAPKAFRKPPPCGPTRSLRARYPSQHSVVGHIEHMITLMIRQVAVAQLEHRLLEFSTPSLSTVS